GGGVAGRRRRLANRRGHAYSTVTDVKFVRILYLSHRLLSQRYPALPGARGRRREGDPPRRPGRAVGGEGDRAPCEPARCGRERVGPRRRTEGPAPHSGDPAPVRALGPAADPSPSRPRRPVRSVRPRRPSALAPAAEPALPRSARRSTAPW